MPKDQIIKIIKESESKIKKDFEDFEPMIRHFNQDVNELLRYQSVISELYVLYNSYSTPKKAVADDLGIFYHNLWTNYFALLTILLRIFNLFKKISKLVDTFETSIHSGNIKKLIDFVTTNEEIIQNYTKDRFAPLTEAKTYDLNYRDELGSLYRCILNNYIKPKTSNTLQLKPKYDKFIYLEKLLDLRVIRNNQVAHYDTQKKEGLSISSLNLGFYFRPEFQELLDLLDGFLGDLSSKCINLSFTRGFIGGDNFVKNYVQMIDDFVSKDYLQRKTDLAQVNINYDDIMNKKLPK